MQGFETPEFQRIRGLITSGSEDIDINSLVKLREESKIDARDFNILIVMLAKRTESQLAEAKGMLERYSLNDRRKKPRMPGEKRHIEVSEDGTQKFS